MILSVQYMRALAALLVVFAHAAWKGAQYSNDSWSWFRVGACGVDLFFIISGFIMCQTTQDRAVDFRAFMKARVQRIIPLYWALSLIALAVFLLFPGKVNSSGGTTSILHSFTLLPSSSKYLIQTGWTLSYEFLFYFIFGLALYVQSRYRHLIPVSVIIALVTFGLVMQPTGVWPKFLTHPLLLEFIMGIGAFHLFRVAPPNHLVSGVTLLAGIASLTWVNIAGPFGHRAFQFGLPCLLIFIGMRGLEDVFVRHARTPLSQLMKLIGDASYSLYLIHPFSLVAAAIVFKRIGLTAYGDVFVVGLVVAASVSAVLCYRWLEQPLTRQVKRLDQHLRQKQAAKLAADTP